MIPGSERSPGGGQGNHSSILAWKIPWTKEPGRLQSKGSQRVRAQLSGFHFHFSLIVNLFVDGSASKESAAMQETLVQSLGQEDPPEKEMATHFSILA